VSVAKRATMLQKFAQPTRESTLIRRIVVITADQLIAHAVGDFILQSDWMATEKTKRSLAALVHAGTYTLPFLYLTRLPVPLLIIFGTHFAIDRWRLSRYVVWAKNWLAPVGWNRPWSECLATGYPPDRPAWLSVWLLIVTDNILHVVCNGLALTFA
jgi:hypothetical protein